MPGRAAPAARRAAQILRRIYVAQHDADPARRALRISMIFNFTGVMIAEMYASRTGVGHHDRELGRELP